MDGMVTDTEPSVGCLWEGWLQILSLALYMDGMVTDTQSSIVHGCWDLNSGPHMCAVSALNIRVITVQ